MQIGFYVRCPLYTESADTQYPRCFMLAQIKSYNSIAETYTVEPRDLLGTSYYYLESPTKVYMKDMVERCPGAIGGTIHCSQGDGVILAHSEPEDEEEPYRYYIQLNSGNYVVLSEQEVQIEYTQMDYSPVKQMKNYEFQNPTWYANRVHVGRNVNFINNASYGFKTMAGCRAYLLPHQISTVARCFETTPIRYMLADEVGLGKTIEACGIVKIMASENTSLRSLFVVPGSLLNQWKNELTYKFNFGTALDSGRAMIVPLEEYFLWEVFIKKVKWDILIIDETHRLLSDDSLYDALLTMSQKVENVLLLSATPIQDRKEEYHRLLSLLLPEQYLTMSESRFSTLVKKQKSIQRSVNIIIQRMSAFEDYAEDIIERVDSVCETLGDDRLGKMVAEMHTAENKVEQIQEIVSYICENYRLERRVIRNRRSAIATAMPKRTLCEIPYLPGTADDNYDESGVVDSLMRYLSEQDEDDDEFLEKVAQPLIGASFSSPWALEAKLNQLEIKDDALRSCTQRWKLQARQELQQIDYMLDSHPEEIQSRFLRIVDYIEQNTDLYVGEEKLVVFTGFTETLKIMKEVLNYRLKKHGLYAVDFAGNMSRESLEDSVYSFQNDENCRIILCDETGGEGRNFQNAKRIIHMDLPWTANALEQRIGRLDRLGRDPEDDVLSVVIYAMNMIDEQLFKIWRDGMQLFTQSLSGMEIITGELNEQIMDALADDYYNGLGNALKDIMDLMEDMRDAVYDEQQFDVGATIYRPLSKAVEEMLGMYLAGENEEFARSMVSWSKQVGLASSSQKGTDIVHFKKNSFETRSALQSLFAPPDWGLYDNTSIVKRTSMIQGTFSRKMAIEREDLLFFAPSDPVYEAIAANAMGCSRGRCCAIRLLGKFNYTGFVFTYVVQPNIQLLIDRGFSPKILAQFRIFLPLKPLTVFIPLTKESRTVPAKYIKAIINQPWYLRRAIHLGQRSKNSDGWSNVERFMYNFPEDHWEPLVNQATQVSAKRAYETLQESADMEAAKHEINRLISGRRAECAYFGKDPVQTEREIEMYQSALEALTTSSVVVDSICFIEVRNNG